MPYDNLLFQRDGPVAIVTVNRPQARNALNRATLTDLEHALRDIAADETVRCSIITGAVDKAFIAGADIGELAGQTPATAHGRSSRGQKLFFDLIEGMGKPTIAAINGYALGAGCELALACTFRIAAEAARMGQPEINLGVMPGYGGTQRLTRVVGRARALDLLLTGAPVDAVTALRIGLVHQVVPNAELLPTAVELGHQLSGKAPVAMRAILTAVHRGEHMPLSDGCALEAALFAFVASTDDSREGTRAFLEKRPARFTGA